MTFEEVIKYFGSGYRVSLDCGFSMSTPPSWKRSGFIPIYSQLKIERHTEGALKASAEHCYKAI